MFEQQVQEISKSSGLRGRGLFETSIECGFMRPNTPVTPDGSARARVATASSVGVLAAYVGLPRARVERLGLEWPAAASSPWWRLGRRLRGLRASSGLTAQALAARIELWVFKVRAIEDGGASPTMGTLVDWLDACGVSADVVDEIKNEHRRIVREFGRQTMWMPTEETVRASDAARRWGVVPNTARKMLRDLGYERREGSTLWHRAA